MEDAFPNVAIAIQMFLTIPVEHISSSQMKMKLVQDCFKTLENKNLSIISIESRIANSLDFEDLFKSCALNNWLSDLSWKREINAEKFS